MELLLVTIMFGAVVAIVGAPLRRAVRLPDGEPSERAAIEAEREAKYREILDAKLDYGTGKLSEADYREIDRTLRGEAVELLRRLDDEP